MIKEKMLQAIKDSEDHVLQYNGDWDNEIDIDKAAEKCTEICHEQMIAFAEWTVSKGLAYHAPSKQWKKFNGNLFEDISREDLLQIYLKEKENGK